MVNAAYIEMLCVFLDILLFPPASFPVCLECLFHDKLLYPINIKQEVRMQVQLNSTKSLWLMGFDRQVAPRRPQDAPGQPGPQAQGIDVTFGSSLSSRVGQLCILFRQLETNAVPDNIVGGVCQTCTDKKYAGANVLAVGKVICDTSIIHVLAGTRN